MKKLLFLLSFIVTCYTGMSQNLVTLKGGQFGVGSLLPVQPFTILGNPTGSIAVPQAYGIGYGLIFQGGKLAVDTTIKDTVFAYNGLQWIGPGTRTIGLGGFLAQNTTISGSNLYDLTLDSMQAAVSRGFRVNFGNDVGYDMFYRDSATGHWKNFGKGAVGQVIGMLSAGGIGWVNQTGGGGGGGGTLTRVSITTGTSSTIAASNSLVKFNFSASISAYSLTFPASPADQDVIEIQGGPTITLGNVEVTTLTMVANAGQTLFFNPNILFNSGGDLRFRYNATGTYWDQVYAH